MALNIPSSLPGSSSKGQVKRRMNTD